MHLMANDVMGADLSEESATAISRFPLRVILSTGEKLLGQKRYGTAEKVFNEALQKKPWSLRGLSGLGTVYIATNKPEEAARCFRRVMLYYPDRPKAMEGYGHALSLLEDFAHARSWFQRGVVTAPELRSVSIALGVTQLRLGDWQKGFTLYDLREGVATLGASIGQENIWDGRADLNRKTILVVGEQGYGDHIQFLRYCTLLKEKGARVFFFTREPLRRLCEWVPSIDKILVDGQKAAFDYGVMAMSLPRLFRTQPDTIPFTSPYILPPWDAGAATAQNSKPRIAIAWKGNPANSRDDVRSCPPNLMEDLIRSTANASFHALPFDIGTEKNTVLSRLPTLCDADANFSDVAMALESIDLIISVDTSLAHLGGAIGKQTWLLIGRQPDWRWLTSGEDSLWYDNVHLFRVATDWMQLIARVKVRLDRFIIDHVSRI
ncbi:tetratricopeptide repeat protein [Nisaea sp.]|uniref:tetratricopeptide repeat protein n=1 Tax=Nisaea sp. TaxID=2024842 RepID=UPI0032F04998